MSEEKCKIGKVSIYNMPRIGVFSKCGYVSVKQDGYDFSYDILYNPKTKEIRINFCHLFLDSNEKITDFHKDLLKPIAEKGIADYLANKGLR